MVKAHVPILWLQSDVYDNKKKRSDDHSDIHRVALWLTDLIVQKSCRATQKNFFKCSPKRAVNTTKLIESVFYCY